MCTTSAVLDAYRPIVDQRFAQFFPHDHSTEILEEIRAFRRLYEAARAFDIKTGQPDCEDPEKAKLLKRVDELEARLIEVDKLNDDGH